MRKLLARLQTAKMGVSMSDDGGKFMKRAIAMFVPVVLLLQACGGGSDAGQAAKADAGAKPAETAPAAGSGKVAKDLADTSWQLVSIRAGGEEAARPKDQETYSLSFGGNGMIAAQVDCNRGRSNWGSPAPGKLSLGMLFLTRAQCPSDSLHDRIVSDWKHINTYALKDGNLELALDAGTTYVLKPAPK